MIDKNKLIEFLEKKKEMMLKNIAGVHPVSMEAVIDAIKDFSEEVVSDINVGNKWIPVSERLPENEEEVEISCVRRYIGAGDEKKERHFTARAFYSDGTMTTEDSDFAWNDIDNWEYDEEKDAYIIPEGWWEYVTFFRRIWCSRCRSNRMDATARTVQGGLSNENQNQIPHRHRTTYIYRWRQIQLD